MVQDSVNYIKNPDSVSIDIEEPVIEKGVLAHVFKGRHKKRASKDDDDSSSDKSEDEDGSKHRSKHKYDGDDSNDDDGDDVDGDDGDGNDDNDNDDDKRDETDSPRERSDSETSFIQSHEDDELKEEQKRSNTLAAKKTVAQGMMDIALLTANANQLRYIIEFNRNSSTFYLNITLIVISLVLQIAVGIALIFKGRMDLRGESKHANAKRINNYVVVGVFLVTIINVFIASFTITGNSK